ncbi:MAG: helix-turn-helix domain-containing protein [Clostridia bacterium]|nr:helix-turn-helix domain-containing protein [Clostridia bacterium]
MKDDFTRVRLEKLFNVDKMITIFYMELAKNFYHDLESHDFWEMVYIDKGEMICTADKNKFTLKSGEMTFHKPGELHNLSGNNDVFPNVSIITFECKSRAMKQFEGKIFKLNAEEKAILSSLFSEGLSCFKLADETNPLLQKLDVLENAPYGASQMTKNLLEIFLIKLSRNTDVLTKKMRRSYVIDGVDVPYNVKEILDCLKENVYGRITVKDVAERVGKSESTVKQTFSEYRKNGIMKYYTELKIKEAKKLIKEGQYNMTQISDLLCFDNPQYFSKCFKTHAKMTPSEYKNSIVTLTKEI